MKNVNKTTVKAVKAVKAVKTMKGGGRLKNAVALNDTDEVRRLLSLTGSSFFNKKTRKVNVTKDIYSVLELAFRNKNKEIVALLLKSPQANAFVKNVLHKAIQKGNKEISAFLLADKRIIPDIYTAAIFFDNDKKHILNFEKKLPAILSIKVNETPGIPTSNVTDPNSDISKYIEAEDLRDNFYVKLIKILGDNIENYDKLSGINAADIAKLDAWIRQTAGQKNRAAIFDWDRTITKCEGILLPAVNMPLPEALSLLAQSNHIPIEGVDIIEEFLTFICGGKERFGAIRKMFNACKDNNINIVILTNNPMCNLYGFIFQDTLNRIIKPLPEQPVTFICSHPFGGNKVDALLSSDKKFVVFSGN